MNGKFLDRVKSSYMVLASFAIFGFCLMAFLEPRQSGQILYSVLTCSVFVFTYVYASGSNWRATQPGRALLYTALMFSGFVAWATISFWIGPQHEDIKSVVRGIITVFLMVMFVNFTLTVRRIQKYSRIQDQDQDKCPDQDKCCN